MSHPVWTPSPEVVAAANTTRFAHAHGLADHAELLQRSLDDPAWFWDAVVTCLDLGFRTPHHRVLDASAGPAWTTWFDGATLNLAWSCVGRHAATDAADRPAVIAEREDGVVGEDAEIAVVGETAQCGDVGPVRVDSPVAAPGSPCGGHIGGEERRGGEARRASARERKCAKTDANAESGFS